jgi:hypothetical protein
LWLVLRQFGQIADKNVPILGFGGINWDNLDDNAVDNHYNYFELHEMDDGADLCNFGEIFVDVGKIPWFFQFGDFFGGTILDDDKMFVNMNPKNSLNDLGVYYQK